MKNLKGKGLLTILLVLALFVSSASMVFADLQSFLVQAEDGRYYEYNSGELNNSYLQFQMDPTNPAADMYEQFLAIGGSTRVVALGDSVKGWMDFAAAQNASLAAQIAEVPFVINDFFATPAAPVYAGTVTDPIVVKPDGTTADLEAYNAALADVATKVEADYTADSWANLQTVLAANVMTSANTQVEINTAVGAINGAIEALVEVPAVDLAAYDAAVAAANAKVEADYTADSWTNLQTVKAANVMTVANTQVEIDAAVAAINTAVAGLVFADQADLDAAKTAAAAKVEADYTAVTYAPLKTALALPETTNAEVVAKTAAITDAIAGLVEVADMDAYDAIVAAAGEVVEADYTAATYAALQTALTDNVVTNQDSQADVDAATAAINAAYDALVKILKVESVSAINANGVEAALEGATILADKKITIIFNNEIDSTTVTSSNFRVFMDGIAQATGTVALDSADKHKVTITAPAAGYTVNKAAVLTMTAGIKDITGAALTATNVNFNISDKPVILTQTHSNDGTLVDGSTIATLGAGAETITYTFNVDMSETSLKNTANVKLYNTTDSTWVTIPSTNYATTDAKTLVVTLPALEADKEYKMVFTSDVKALAGAAMKNTEIKYFTGTATTLTATVPTTTTTNVYNSLVASPGKTPIKWVGTFNSAVDAATVIGDNIKLREASTTGTVIATTISYDNASQTVTLTPTADLKASTKYYVVWTADIKQTNGRAVTANNAWFQTGDFVKPTVVSTTPANAAVDVAVDGSVVINFSKAMNPATVTLGDTSAAVVSLKNLTDNTDKAITGWTTSWNDAKTTFTMKPTTTTKLEANKSYKLTIKKSVADTAANTMTADVTATFNTATAAATKFVNVKSATNATSDPVVASGVTKIDKAANFFINYDQTLDGATINNTNVTIQQLNLSTGIYDTTVNPATAPAISGTKAIKITGTGAFVEDNTYKITVTSGVKDSYNNSVQETTFILTTGPKPAVDTAASYPATFATNVDTTVPYVITVIDDGNSDLKAATLNTVTLTNKADGTAAPYSIASTVATKPGAEVIKATNGAAGVTTTLSDAQKDNVVVGDILMIGTETQAYTVVSKAGDVITLDRSLPIQASTAVTRHQGVVFKLNDGAALAGNTEYNVTANGVQDVAGNAADDTTFTFRTATVDTKLEYVSGTVTNGSTGVAVNTPLEFTFNSPVDAGTITLGTGGVTVSGLTQDTDFTVALKSGDNKTIVITPNSFLAADTAYTVTFTTSLKNTYGAGTALATAKAIAFQTETPASIAPQIVSAMYFDAGTVTGVDAGDKIIVQLNTPVDPASLTLTNIAANFELSGGGSLGTNPTATVSTDGKTITITLVGSPVLFPNSTQINAKSGLVQDLNGSDFATTAVTITK